MVDREALAQRTRQQRNSTGDRDASPLEPTARSETRTGAAPRVIHSTTLLAGASQLAIMHNETIYFLRQTRLGKLILTK